MCCDVTCIHIVHNDNDITNQLLNVLPCNMYVVHPWWECYPRLTPQVTFPPRVNNIACYMAEHLTIDKTHNIVISLKTFSALIGGNCTTWPCNNCAWYTAARVTILLLKTRTTFCENKRMHPMIRQKKG